MTVLVVLTVVVIVLLIAGLAVYLYWAGTLLDRIGAKLEGAADLVGGIVADAKLIGPGVEHINATGGVVAGALPLLYGMAEGIVAGVTPAAPVPEVPEPARPASGTRRSRLLSGVGYESHLYRYGTGAACCLESADSILHMMSSSRSGVGAARRCRARGRPWYVHVGYLDRLPNSNS
jgi:hypothetical protein